MKLNCVLTLVTMVMTSVAASRSYGMKVINSYRDINSDSLLSVDMDTTSGTIIIGGDKSVIMLNENLELKESANMDYNQSKVRTVAIDSKSKSVILCSSVSGRCETRSLRSLDKVLVSNPDHLVPSYSESGSVLLLLAKQQKLVLANSFVITNDFDDLSVPMISSRSTDDLALFHSDARGSSAKYIANHDYSGAYYDVTYIHSFAERGFVYFVSRTPNRALNASVTKIGRICLDDKYFQSYVEIELHCADSHEPFTLVQSAFYDHGQETLFVSLIPGGYSHGYTSSAICRYSLHDINKMMDSVVRDCYNGRGLYGPLHFHKISSCVPTKAKPSLCGGSDVSEAYASIEGQSPLYQKSLITLPYVHVTSIVSRSHDEHTDLYLGTNNGEIKKVTVSSSGLISMKAMVDLESSHDEIKSMMLNKEGDYLFAMTSSKLVKIDVDNCEHKTSCQECMTSVDSVCGWCVMENRCTRQEKCPSGVVSPRWLASSDGVCADMKDLSPASVSVPAMTHDDTLSFKLDSITLDDDQQIDIHCSFVVMETRHRTIATKSGDRIFCPLPERAKMPALPIGQVVPRGDHGVLEVEFQIHGKTVVKRDVSVYNCQVNLNCTSCTESQYGCNWCHVKGLCVESSRPCENQTLPAISTSGKCPQLVISSADTDVVVHSGTTKKIALRVANMMPDQMRNVHCLFAYENEVKLVQGNITSTHLICEPWMFEYKDANLPIMTAVFTVTAGENSIPLDNPQNIKVRIYKCGPMVTNCGQCLSMDAEYDCGWCTAGIPQCSLQSDCPSAEWLDRGATCPHPQILRFSPFTGPINGRTNISVTGLNLLKTYKDLEVTVAGIKCPVQPYQAESSQRFVCQLVGPDAVKEGAIKIEVAGTYTTESNTHFKFVDPVVTGLTPKQGPESGGTVVTIIGEYMNTGSERSVELGGRPCKVVSSNETTLECMTSQLITNDRSADVEVDFSGLKKLVPQQFEYVKDPEISMIEPKNTILSGGTSITAMGHNMQIIQRPELFVEHDGRKFSTKCTLEPLTGWLLCKTPKLNFLGENITETSPKEVHYGFSLDGVLTYKNISMDPGFGPLLYYPDPNVELYPPPGKDMKKKDSKHLVVVKGNFRRINPVMADVNITIGGTPCTKPTATDDAISCNPPDTPKEVTTDGNAMIVLQIGNMKTEVGYIKYFDTDDKGKPIAVGIILGVVLPILAIIALLAVCVIRRHRKHKPSEDYIPDVWKDEKKEEEELELNHVSVKADMNGSIPEDKDTAPYIDELLSKVESDSIKENIRGLLISRSKLDIGDLLGKGNFGVTYKATICQNEEEIPKDVAVKSVQGSLTDSDNVAQFLQTVSHLRDLQHPHLVPITGVCITISDDPMIVVPYSQNGDLKSYVRDSNKDLKVSELLEFGHQIAEVMSYLSNQSVVHGNLALRNCLLNDNKQVLVGDYGLHQDLFTKDQYTKAGDKHKSLIKWSAPEILEGDDMSVVTSQSDVWSYGVVLWELLTRGISPYPDVDSADILDHVKTGHRMKKPKQCPEDVYGLMKRCWTVERESRPTFQQIDIEIQTFTTSELSDQSMSESTPLQVAEATEGSNVV